MPKCLSIISLKIPKLSFQASIWLLGFLDNFWDNIHLMIFPSLVFIRSVTNKLIS